MAMARTPSGINHLVEEILAWDFPEAQSIVTFAQKRLWGNFLTLLAALGESLLLPFPSPTLLQLTCGWYFKDQ